MSRSISFVVEGDVDTRITITETTNAETGAIELLFDIAVLGSGLIGDLRGLFFDLKDPATGDPVDLTTLSAVGVTAQDLVSGSEFAEGAVDNLGQGVNLNGAVTNELGDFDAGIEFGTAGIGEDDVRETSFVLSSTTGALSLDMLDLADFGIRYTSVGEEGGSRTGSLKIGDVSGGVADDDAWAVDENATGSVDLLANDTNGATNTVTAVSDAGGGFTAVAGGFEREVVVDGRVLGTLGVTAAGIASFAATGADVDRLGHDATPVFAFDYTTTAADGSSFATAGAELTVRGVNDTPVAQNVAGTVGEDDASVAVAFAASDIDAGDLLSFQVLGAPTDASGNQYGSVVNNADGTFTFLPGDQFQFLDAGETRDVSFQYVAIDDSGTATDTSAPVTATITVTGAFDAPVVLGGELLFRTSDQSMFGTGDALVLQPVLPFFGLQGSENLDSTFIAADTVSGGALETILEGIDALGDFFEDIGCAIGSIFGGDCGHDHDVPTSISTPRVGTDGSLEYKVGLQPYFSFTSGDVDGSIPVDVVFTTPRQVEAGESFTIGSAFSLDKGSTFTTASPDVNFGMDFVFDVDTDLDLMVGSSRIGLIDFDTAGISGFDGKLGQPGVNLFDFSAADDLQTSFDFGGLGTLDLNFPVINTTGSLADADTLTSSGEDDVAVLDLDLDAMLSLIPGVPPFGDSGSFGVGFEIGGVDLNLISVDYAWDVISANLTSTLSVIQDFSLDVLDLPLLATLEDGSTISGFSVGDEIAVTAPDGFDALVEGDTDGLIDFDLGIDMDAVFGNLSTLGFSMELFTGLLRLTGGISSDFFDGPSFSLFPRPDAADFFVSDTFTLLDDAPLATLFDEEFPIEGWNQDTFAVQFDVA